MIMLRSAFKFSMYLLCSLMNSVHALTDQTNGVYDIFFKDKSSHFNLIDIRFENHMQSIARSLSRSVIQMEDGELNSLRSFYIPDFPNVGLTFSTRVSDEHYWIIGFDTGTQGDKYIIYPSIQFGWYSKFYLSRNLVFEANVSLRLGGRFKEKSCIADFGSIASSKEINCRLADSILPPNETLNYLANFRGNVHDFGSMRITYTF